MEGEVAKRVVKTLEGKILSFKFLKDYFVIPTH